MQTTTAKPRTYTLQFWLLCFSSFLFFMSFNMIIPELPAYLTELGGEDYKGLIISLFTLTAGLSRPFSGKLTDRIGRIPVMVFGALVCFVIGFIYPMVTTVLGFFVLRFFHGFSTGFKPTGTVAYIADIVPFNRRGEAMGLSGIFGQLGMGTGLAISSVVAQTFSHEFMFRMSSVVSILSIIILVRMKETLTAKETFRFSHLKISWSDVYDPDVLKPSVVMFLTTFSFGIVLTVIPDFSAYHGITNKGLYFVIFLLASLAVRVVAGRISDNYGRERVVLAAALLYVLGMAVTGSSQSPMGFYVGALIFGLGTGMNTPTIFAWVADLAKPEHRGRGMATVFIALEVGIMLGALSSGWIYGNNSDNFIITFLSGAFLSLLAAVYIIRLLVLKK